jgi:hypothetical protein
MASPKTDKRPSLPPKRSQRISLETATDLTQRYRKAAPASEHAGFFHADGLRALLEQPGVVGMRIYHGLDKRGRYRMVLVGVDANGQDLVRVRVRGSSESGNQKQAKAAMSGDAVILDQHWPCPPFCPRGSPLN